MLKIIFINLLILQTFTSNQNFQTYYPMSNEISSFCQASNLIESYTFENKYDCFTRCNQNSNCTMVYFKNNSCMVYNRIQYLCLTSLNSQTPSLFNKYVPLE